MPTPNSTLISNQWAPTIRIAPHLHLRPPIGVGHMRSKRRYREDKLKITM